MHDINPCIYLNSIRVDNGSEVKETQVHETVNEVHAELLIHTVDSVFGSLH